MHDAPTPSLDSVTIWLARCAIPVGILTIVAGLLSLLLSLTGCVSTPEPVQVRTVYVLPPAEWMQVRGVPPLRGNTWADVEAWGIETAAAHLECEIDDAALMEWIEENHGDTADSQNDPDD